MIRDARCSRRSTHSAATSTKPAFDLNSEDPQLRDQYGQHRYGQSALLARRLVGAGARCVNINSGNWDHHNDIAKGLDERLPPLDRAIATLVEDLSTRGLLNDVIIYCVGEFGRTPRMNGHAGRDHWSDCFRVIGKSHSSSPEIRRTLFFRIEGDDE